MDDIVIIGPFDTIAAALPELLEVHRIENY